jgi:tRNA guanosine-2'-O-methyltransferase
MECEGDLDFLASNRSTLKPEWLYTLLSASLVPKIQDSNRKFIGGWIMRSEFQPDVSENFVDFFRDGFLPWATQGSLFTSTLKSMDCNLRCLHGDRLAGYVSCLLIQNATNDALSSALINVVLWSITSRRSGSFAYAGVYLLEGLGRAFDSTPDLVLSVAHMEQLVDLASWPALPEVARDYVMARCLKLCAEGALRTPEAAEHENIAKGVHKWKHLREILSHLHDSSTRNLSSSMASWDTQPSNRDILEQEAAKKCQDLRCMSHTDDGATRSLLVDLWSDLEYLEFPKTLVMQIPGVLLDPQIVRLALTSDELAATLSSLTEKLRDLSENRVYLLSPLMGSIRKAIFVHPEAAKLVPLEDLILHYAEHLPEPTIDLQLDDATISLLLNVDSTLAQLNYGHYFGERRSVGVAALLDIVSRLGSEQTPVLESVRDRVLQRWAKQRSPPPTVSPWKSTLQLQLLVLCCEQTISSTSEERILEMLKDLHYVLSIEPLPRYRYLLSWTIARIYVKHQRLQGRVLSELSTKDHHSNPKYLASLMKIGVMLAKVEGATADYAEKLASTFVPLAASSKVVIRHEAQWQIPLLMDHARANGWSRISESAAFAALDEYIRSLERFDDPPLERQLDRFDPVNDHTMTNLVEGRWFGLDSIESPTCGRADFLKLYDREGTDVPPACVELGEPVAPLPTTNGTTEPAPSPPAKESNLELTPGTSTSGSRALQTKGTAYLTNEPQISRNNIIVIASLVDNPYNLGGLSRVSEIFGASELHLQNQNVTGTKDFVSVAVSSHLHFPICQLSAPGVPAYLAEKRSEGWAIVGIEQTDRSVLLGSAECKLPEKVVLVIGSEKEGIPALVLSECNLLVEIPQQGITRSLNVQTAAAIVLFEYARQHHLQTNA